MGDVEELRKLANISEQRAHELVKMLRMVRYRLEGEPSRLDMELEEILQEKRQ